MTWGYGDMFTDEISDCCYAPMYECPHGDKICSNCGEIALDPHNISEEGEEDVEL